MLPVRARFVTVPGNTVDLFHHSVVQGLGTPWGPLMGHVSPSAVDELFPGEGPLLGSSAQQSMGVLCLFITHPKPLLPHPFGVRVCVSMGADSPGAAISATRVLNLVPLGMCPFLPRPEFSWSYLHQGAVQGLSRKACSGWGSLLRSFFNIALLQ